MTPYYQDDAVAPVRLILEYSDGAGIWRKVRGAAILSDWETVPGSAREYRVVEATLDELDALVRLLAPGAQTMAVELLEDIEGFRNPGMRDCPTCHGWGKVPR